MPSAVTIVSNVANQHATGLPGQRHLLWGAGVSTWWLFYLGGTNTINLLSSSDFATWTSAGSSTLGRNHASEGRNFGFAVASDTDTGKDALHMASSYRDGSDYTYAHHGRFLASSPTSYTFAEAQSGTTDSGGTSTVSSGAACEISSQTFGPANGPFDVNPYGANGNALGLQAGYQGTENFGTFTLSPSWASCGTVAKQVSSVEVFNVGGTTSRKMLVLGDDADPGSGSATNVVWSRLNSNAWSAPANVFGTNLGAAIDPGAWNGVKVSATDYHLVALDDGASTFRHARYNATSWSAGDAIPDGSYGAGSNLILVTDGTYVHLFCFDSTGALMTTKWTSGAGWGNWGTMLAASGNDRRGLAGWQNVVSGNVGLIWTEYESGQWNIKGLSGSPDVIVSVMVYSCDSAGASERAGAFGSSSALESIAVPSAERIILGSGDSAALREGSLSSLGPGSTDAASASEGRGLASTLAGADRAALAEDSDALSSLSAMDQGSGSDASAPVSTSTFQAIYAVDSIRAAEAWSLTVLAGSGDPISEADLGRVASALGAGDAALAQSSDQPSGAISEFMPIYATDSILASEAWTLTATVAGLETPLASESAGGSADLRAADDPSRAGEANYDLVILGAGDAGQGSDAAGSLADLRTSDRASAADRGAVLALAGAADAGLESEASPRIFVGARESIAAFESGASIGLASGDSAGARERSGVAAVVASDDALAEVEALGGLGVVGGRDLATFREAMGVRSGVRGVDSATIREAWSVHALLGAGDVSWAIETDEAWFLIGIGDVVGARESKGASIAIGSVDGAAAREKLALSVVAAGVERVGLSELGSPRATLASADAVRESERSFAYVSHLVVCSVDSISSRSLAGVAASPSGSDSGRLADVDSARESEIQSVLARPGSGESVGLAESAPRIALGASDAIGLVERKDGSIVVGSSDVARSSDASSLGGSVASTDAGSAPDGAGLSALAGGSDLTSGLDVVHASDAQGFASWGSGLQKDGYFATLVDQAYPERSATIVRGLSIDPFQATVIHAEPAVEPPPPVVYEPLRPERRLINVKKRPRKQYGPGFYVKK